MGSVQTSERIDGANHPAVLTTKTLAESTHSQQELEKSEHILIVGGGQVGLEAADARYIANIFGSNAPRVFNLVGDVEAAEGLSLRDTLVLHYTMREEMVLTPVDYFLRRTNYLLFMRETLDDLIQPVANEMEKFLGWSEEEKEAHLAELDRVLAESDLRDLKAAAK